MKTKTFLIALGLSSSLLAHGQTIKVAPNKDNATSNREARKPDLEDSNVDPVNITLYGGPSWLSADLGSIVSTYSGGVGVFYPFARGLSVGVQADFGTFKAEQEEFFNARSKATFQQGAAVIAVDPLRLFNVNTALSLNIYAGAGLIYFKAQAFDLTTDELLRTSNDAGSYRTKDGVNVRGNPGVKQTHELAIPLGFRLGFPLTQRLNIFGEFRYNYIYTDKLDATLDRENYREASVSGEYHKNNSEDKWYSMALGVNFFLKKRTNFKSIFNN
ncbi:hypothetical protein [Tellurirhabdus bombi]|uniref:hypothetical protein n=1 Tax=Tellurirhabdus bombi TaxID=2907205 RepID=UPI001F2F5E2F|nr:hypothetical protein [Tellurirhabdus bombi]